MLIAQHVLAQVTDSFSDGDFANTPAWSGNDSRFAVENEELRLKAEAVSGSAFLSTQSHAVENATWECSLRMTFNPSGTNYTRIYILSDSHDLTGSLNGYFVMIGDTPDEISLYKQSGFTKIKIIDGVNGRVNLASVNVRIKVTRDQAGQWELFSDVGITGSYISEGSAIDNSWVQTLWCGLVCTYTATRSDDFYFDDIVVTGSPITDSTPPHLEKLTVISSREIKLVFSEQLAQSPAGVINNYVLSPGSKHPNAALLDEEAKTVLLSFEEPFANARQSALSISQLEDVHGNKMIATEQAFLFFQPIDAANKDVIITEIFPDPEPTQGLPSAEFIELFNRSEKIFDLSGWVLTDGTSSAVFPNVFLFPGDHLVVTSSGNADAFSEVEKRIGLSGFPSLNNSGDVLLLKDLSGTLIDGVNYSDTWYRDDGKQAGGWTLELIDPQNICSEEENWIASEASNGGTPGKQNSVFANNPDLTGPSIVSAIPVSETEIVIQFNEKLQNVLPSQDRISIKPDIGILNIVFEDSLLRAIRVTLAKPLATSITYSIIANEIYDCAGNLIQSPNAISFGLPERAGRADIVINEILFNPASTGVDFVELYNNSLKFVNLKGMTLMNAAGSTSQVSAVDRLIAPYQYIVVSTDRDAIIGEYPSSAASVFCDVVQMPSMNDDEGEIRLLNETHAVDSFRYSKEMHSPFLKDDEGVSLERISFYEETNLASNWKSASSSAGFATPGFINSNARPEFKQNAEISIEPEVFSPLHGQQDFALVHYAFDRGGFVANIDILDSYGRTVFNIANNEILGASGFFRWDGNTSGGSKARVGYYMVKFEVFDATGVVRVFKKRLAIASRF